MDNIRVKGYKRLENLNLLELGRVNYLVGGNASGKSSVLECLKILNDGSAAAAHSGSFLSKGFSKHAINPLVGVSITIEKSNCANFTMSLAPDVKIDQNGNVESRKNSFYISANDVNTDISSYSENSSRRDIARSAHISGKQGFGISTHLLSTRTPNNNDYAAAADHAALDMTNIDDAMRSSMLDFLNKYHPHSSGKTFVDIVKATHEDGAILLKLAETSSDGRGEFYYTNTVQQHPMLALSDGMRALLGLYYSIEERLRNGQQTVRLSRVICLEEPEYGLHPDNQKKVADILNDFTQKYTDVIFVVTTHSPFLISRASQLAKAGHKIYLLSDGASIDLMGHVVPASSGYSGSRCLNVVAKMLGAGFGDLNSLPQTAEDLTIVYCEGESKDVKDSQIYKRIFRDENIVFVSSKDFFRTVVAFRIGEQSACFTFGERTVVRALVDRSYGCRPCGQGDDKHQDHEQEFSITAENKVKFTHPGHLMFDDADIQAIEASDVNGHLKVLQRKEIENYLFDPVVTNLFTGFEDNVVLPANFNCMGEVKDKVTYKNSRKKVVFQLADIIRDNKNKETKDIYNELAGYIGL